MKQLARKEFNFLIEAQRKPQKTVAAKQRSRLILIFVLLLVIVLGAFGWMEYRTYQLNQKAAELESYINDDNRQARYLEELNLMEEISEVESRYEGLYATSEAMNSYPVIAQPFFERLDLAGSKVEIRSVSYDLQSGVLHLEAAADDVTEAASFAQKLEELPENAYVSYTGYSSENTGKQYLLSVDVLLMQAQEAVQ